MQRGLKDTTPPPGVRRTQRRAGVAGQPDIPLPGLLADRWKEFLKQLRHCRAECTEPAVHDLRVAIRRLVAAVDLLTAVSPGDQLITARQHLKRLLRHMGPLRDAQVQRLAVKKLSREFPDLEVFSTVLLLREQGCLRRISRRLGRLPTRSIQQALFHAARSLDRSLRNPGVKSAVGFSFQGVLAAAFLRVVESSRRIDAAAPATVHRLRIAFKKFRYATEILRPDIEKSHHQAMNDYQTTLGDIRDRELLLESIAGFRVRTSLRQMGGRAGRAIPPDRLAGIERRLRRQHSALVRQCVRSVNGFYRFYPPS